MSKKNNKATKRRLHEHDLKKEAQEREKRQKQLEKKQSTQAAQAATTGGVKKLKRRKPIRIRKGVKVKGIKVVDSDSKKKLKQLLKAEAAMQMDIDNGVKSKVVKKKTGKAKSLKVKGLGDKAKKDKKAAASSDRMAE